MAAGVLAALTGEYVDAGVIFVVLVLNAAIGFAQEYQAERSVQALMRMVAPRARVVRTGHEHEIPSQDVVPGDVILLETGGKIPADARLASATALLIGESLLTGESTTVTKQVPRSGKYATGRSHEHGVRRDHCRQRPWLGLRGCHWGSDGIGRHRQPDARRSGCRTTTATPAGKFHTRVLGGIVAGAAIAAFSLGLARGEAPADMFRVAVALAVAAVPEGLPVAVTVALAVGVRRMAGRNAVVRRLSAVEALGSATVIGSDKTGTQPRTGWRCNTSGLAARAFR
ncbi:MAG: HAD-IC family P-type ATPase [Thermomicrobiales bacterium]